MLMQEMEGCGAEEDPDGDGIPADSDITQVLKQLTMNSVDMQGASQGSCMQL